MSSENIEWVKGNMIKLKPEKFCMILQTKCDQPEKTPCLECSNYLFYKKHYLRDDE